MKVAHRALNLTLGKITQRFGPAGNKRRYKAAVTDRLACAGLKFLSRAWFNLDVVWALSLVLVGAFGIYSAYMGH
ncbi:MAG: hypothetical protein P8P70_07410 [Sulfitobacter sp.]|nr:hypothetical protein [Sulfitobacter sp.]